MPRKNKTKSVKNNKLNFKFEKKELAILIIILLLALAVKSVYLYFYKSPVSSDAAQYDALAYNVMHGKGYILNISLGESNPELYSIGASPTAMRPPGYPVFLMAIYSVFGHNYLPVYIMQIFLSLLTLFLVFIMARHVFNKWVGFLAAAFIAVWPPYIALSAQILTETLFIFLVALIVFIILYILENEKNSGWRIYLVYFALGLIIAYANLVRPTFFLFPFFLIAFFILVKLMMKERIKREFAVKSCLLLVGFLLITSFWVARNYNVFHSFIPGSTQEGIGLYSGTRPFVIRDNVLGNLDPEDPVIIEMRAMNASESEKSDFLKKKGIENFINNPLNVLLIKIENTYYMWATPYMYFIIEGSGYKFFMEQNKLASKFLAQGSFMFYFFKYSYLAVHLLIIFLFILSLFFIRFNNRNLTLYFIVFYFVVMFTITYAIDRYILPIFIYSAIFAFFSAQEILRRMRVKWAQ